MARCTSSVRTLQTSQFGLLASCFSKFHPTTWGSLTNGQTALAVSCVGKCTGENSGSTIDSIVSAKVAWGRSSVEMGGNADWIYGWMGGVPPGFLIVPYF